MRIRRLTARWSRPASLGGEGRGDNIAREGHDAPGDNLEGGRAEGNEGGDDSSHPSSSDDSAANPPINDSESDSSSSDSSDGSDLDLHPGFLAFLSTQQTKIEDDISYLADRLRGEGGRFPGASPLFQISFVREHVRDDGAVQIARAMEEGCSSCHHDDIIGSEGASALLPQSPPRWCPSYHIREIVFSRCHIGDRGAGALARAISKSCTPSLNLLDLSSNNITGAGVTCLANCLVTVDGRGMETLALSSNPIRSSGASALANALRGRRPEDDNSDVGFCCVKKLHISGCRLNDDDAIALGTALLPGTGVPNEVPSLPKTHHLTLLNVHSNCITTRGMEHLYSIIMALGPDDDAESDGLQSLFCKSNHVVDLGVIVDYGTRAYSYGNFFDQEEDELMLAQMREYEMTGAEPNNIEELKAQMAQKISLMHKMADALHVNRQCIVAVRKEEAASTNVPHTLTEECQQILCAGARKKIARAIEQTLKPRLLTLPRRQDEYGKYLEDDFLGLSLFGTDIVNVWQALFQPRAQFVSSRHLLGLLGLC